MSKSYDIHQYHCAVAEVIALKSTCLDKQVGCLLVDKHNNILATGYNGNPQGYPHCTDLGYCVKEKGQPCLAIHAEMNAIIKCADIQAIDRLYVTLSPCIDCLKVLLNTGCKHIYYTTYSSKSDIWMSLSSIPWTHIKIEV